MTKAVAYYRTSSATNVGADKDSERRQADAVAKFAATSAIPYEIVGSFYDAAVRGTDSIEARPGFSSMLQFMDAEGVSVIIVEDASRFARDLMVQEVGYEQLKAAGITLIAADSPDSFVSDTPTATMIRQILGSVRQFEKAMLVSKLKGARDRKRAANGKCDGRKNYAETSPVMVARAAALSGEGLSLRAISGRLAEEGYVNSKGAPHAAMNVSRMLARA